MTSVKLSAAIMAHPSRAEWVADLQAQTGLEDDCVVWDRGDGVWDTASRAWEHHDPEATHHLVIQDDAIACRDLIAGLERGLPQTPAQFICLYVGTPHDGAKGTKKVDALAERAERTNASWLVIGSSRWGLASVLPKSVIADMLLWCDYVDEPDDKRIGMYCRDVLHWNAWHPWPSLVDHRPEGSILGHSRTVARRFIGVEASALDFDFCGGVVS